MKDTASRATELLLRGALATRGALRNRVGHVAPRGGERVLVVAPHPDDEVAGCAGVLAAHRAAGDEIRVVVCTDGGRSRALGLGEAEMAQRRRTEAEVASAILGASLEWLGFPERSWEPHELSAALEVAMTGFAPQVIYAPSRVDYHPDHVGVATALARVVDGFGGLVRIYQVHVPLADPLVNAVAAVGDYAGTVLAALRAHESQWDSLERTLRLRRYAAARRRVQGLAEEFLEIEPAVYAAIHAPPLVPSDSGFRGLRYRPFTDLLAYWRGRGARQAFLRAGSRAP